MEDQRFGVHLNDDGCLKESACDDVANQSKIQIMGKLPYKEIKAQMSRVGPRLLPRCPEWSRDCSFAEIITTLVYSLNNPKIKLLNPEKIPNKIPNAPINC